MLNILESKAGMQSNILRLRESDFLWLMDRYNEKKQHYQHKYGTQTFEQFTDVFLREIVEKIDAAKRILSV
jgi:hypothetical protein